MAPPPYYSIIPYNSMAEFRMVSYPELLPPPRAYFLVIVPLPGVVLRPLKFYRQFFLSNN